MLICGDPNESAEIFLTRPGFEDTEFVKDVRIEDRNVCEHDVACHELEKHVTPNVAGSLLLIGSKGWQPDFSRAGTRGFA